MRRENILMAILIFFLFFKIFFLNEIATSTNQKTVSLLAIRLCHNYSVNYLPPLMLIFYSNFKLFLVYERDCDTAWV